jgi:CheY-like chemotaxis protein
MNAVKAAQRRWDSIPSPETAEEPVHWPETVLVVDDDPFMLQLEVQTLCKKGYHVLFATGVPEALGLAAATPTIHLLITDFLMPQTDGDGLEMTRQFRALHPRTPVLMVSSSLPLLNGRADNLQPFASLPKPFTAAGLAQEVRRLLAGEFPTDAESTDPSEPPFPRPQPNQPLA